MYFNSVLMAMLIFGNGLGFLDLPSRISAPKSEGPSHKWSSTFSQVLHEIIDIPQILS